MYNDTHHNICVSSALVLWESTTWCATSITGSRVLRGKRSSKWGNLRFLEVIWDLKTCIFISHSSSEMLLTRSSLLIHWNHYLLVDKIQWCLLSSSYAELYNGDGLLEGIGHRGGRVHLLFCSYLTFTSVGVLVAVHCVLFCCRCYRSRDLWLKHRKTTGEKHLEPSQQCLSKLVCQSPKDRLNLMLSI